MIINQLLNTTIILTILNSSYHFNIYLIMVGKKGRQGWGDDLVDKALASSQV